ncbi:MAG: hypothetical protein EAZ92_00660 [Candidatus Kapaibacterium sp.]|nr:MAG: hypothetical protein EAZ92_00660 [Candidatus Kapabacteria bacterium]
MREFISIYIGGHDFRLNDIGFIQQASKELIDEIMSSDFLKSGIANPANPFVLRGVVQTGNTFTRGSIFWNGEIYLVDDQSITGSGTLYWEKVVTYSPANVTYEDGQVRQVHEIRKLRPTYTNPGSNGFTNAVLQRYVNPLISFIGEIVGFPETYNPPSLFYLPCNGEDSPLSNPNYSNLNSILPEVTTTFIVAGEGQELLYVTQPITKLCVKSKSGTGSVISTIAVGSVLQVINYAADDGITRRYLSFDGVFPINGFNSNNQITATKIPLIPNNNGFKYYIRAN